MKRFWLEDRWHWAPRATMALTRVPPTLGCLHYLAILVFVHLVPSSSTAGENCDLHKLVSCPANEVCVQLNNSTTGRCEKLPEPPQEDHLNLALGLGISLCLVVVILVVFLLHRKLGLFSGMCDRFASLRHLAIRSGDIILVDNDDEAEDNHIR